ncbi:molybdopterin-binding protein [Zhaonella formicivorans]|uniref:molybdopterin-binding protein n=1 Tax=Zhaonella formicivorans TaxID=2528593 RepID=UPI0010DEBF36|nr:molybdopterin-binding protein [Zhaonella formicivorans]
MKKVKVEEAVGMILCHDITRIVPGESKGPAFRKGHIIRQEDVPKLLDLGKAHIYVWENQEGMLHENDAALRLAKAAAGSGLNLSEPKEGKVNLTAAADGLLKVDVNSLELINGIDQLIIATLHTNRMVKAGQQVAGCRVVPLVIAEEKIVEAERICSSIQGIISVKTLHKVRAGLVTTGSEVYYGRIKDAFGPVIKSKLEQFGSSLHKQVFVPDDVEKIAQAVRELKAEGVDLVLTTGGMSVDPDDLTPTGIKSAGAEIIAYGAPVLPGSMFMLAYLDGMPILGLPGCVMYAKTTIFDLVLPRVLCGEKLSRQDLVKLGHGGLCLNCEVCTFPHCHFGKEGK